MILFVFMFFFYYFVQTHFLLQVRLIGLRPLEWIQHNGIQIQPLNSRTDIDVHNYGGSRRIYSSFIGHFRDSFRHFSLQTNDWQLPLAVKCKIHLRLNSAFTQRWRLKCICNFFFLKVYWFWQLLYIFQTATHWANVHLFYLNPCHLTA